MVGGWFDAYGYMRSRNQEADIREKIESVLKDKDLNMPFQVEAYVELMKKIKADIRANDHISVVTRLAYEYYFNMPSAKLSIDWKINFFGVLNKYLGASDRVKNELTLEILMTEVGTCKGKNQPSFVSKLLHTVRNEEPIYDSKVRAFLQTGDPQAGKTANLKGSAVEIYERIKNFYTDDNWSDLRTIILDVFNAQYGLVQMTDTKKLDFVCWALGKQGRVLSEFVEV